MRLLLFLLLTFSSKLILSQADTLYFFSGEKIECTITQFNQKRLYYRLSNIDESPSIEVRTKRVSGIVYKNGQEDALIKMTRPNKTQLKHRLHLSFDPLGIFVNSLNFSGELNFFEHGFAIRVPVKIGYKQDAPEIREGNIASYGWGLHYKKKFESGIDISFLPLSFRKNAIYYGIYVGYGKFDYMNEKYMYSSGNTAVYNYTKQTGFYTIHMTQIGIKHFIGKRLNIRSGFGLGWILTYNQKFKSYSDIYGEVSLSIGYCF